MELRLRTVGARQIDAGMGDCSNRQLKDTRSRNKKMPLITEFVTHALLSFAQSWWTVLDFGVGEVMM